MILANVLTASIGGWIGREIFTATHNSLGHFNSFNAAPYPYPTDPSAWPTIYDHSFGFAPDVASSSAGGASSVVDLFLSLFG